MKILKTILCLVIVFAVLLPVAAQAAPPQCQVTNTTTEVEFDNLQSAVDAATAGDTLKVKGNCVGSTIIAKDLTLEGKSNPAFGTATLNGGDTPNTPILTINSGNVTIEGLTITGGNSSIGSAILVFPFTQVTLNHTEVSGNMGNAIFSLGGMLTLNSSTVSDSVVTPSGSGGNGIIITFCTFSPGSLTLNNSAVRNNVTGSSGGGIFVQQGCSATLTDSVISHNSAVNGNGGGIWLGTGGVSLTLNNTVVSNNIAGLSGGGIYNLLDGTLTIDATSIISDNIPDNCFGLGCP